MTSKKRTSKQTNNNEQDIMKLVAQCVKEAIESKLAEFVDLIPSQQHSVKSKKPAKSVKALADEVGELPVSVLAASPSEPTKSKKAPKKIKRVIEQEKDVVDDAIELANPPTATKRMTNTLGPDCVPVVDASGAVVVSPIPEKVVEQRAEPPKVKAVIKDGIVTMVPDEY